MQVRTAARWGLVVTLALTACGSEEERPEGEPEPRAATPSASEVDRPHAHEDPLDARLLLVAGPPGQSSHRLAHALQGAAQATGESLSIAPSESDLDPLYLVAWGHADAGVVPANVLASPLHRLAREQVQVIGACERAEAVHIIVAADSPAKAIADLQGKQVSVGRLGSSSELAARDVLVASGLDPDGGEVTLLNHAPTDAIKRLGRGVDAVILVGHTGDVPGAPATRLLTIPADDAAALKGGYTASGSGVVVRPVLVARAAAADVLRKVASSAGTAIVETPAPESVDGPPLALRAEGAALRIAAGPSGGTYQRIADGIAMVVDKGGLGAAEVVPTQGAFESFVLVATGQVDVAIVKQDLLEEALRTPGIAPIVARARLLTPLYKEEVHLAVAAPLDGVAALRGKRVVLGEAGSGTFATARRVLRLSGLQRGDVSGRAIAPGPALDALRAGRVDAVFFVGGQPVSAFEGSNVEFAAIGPLEGYEPATLSYPWLPGPVATVATPALLLCRRDLPAEYAEGLVKALYAHRKNLTALHPKWSELDPAAIGAARPGVRLHSAVEASASKLEPDSAGSW